VEYDLNNCSTPRVPVLCPSHLELGWNCVNWDCWQTAGTSTPLPPSTPSTSASSSSTSPSHNGEDDKAETVSKGATIAGATTAAVILVVVVGAGGILYRVTLYL